jgi:hypothetical protein
MRSANFDMERFNLKKLNDVAVKEQYQIKISYTFAPLENMDGGGGGGDDDDDVMGINRAWENIRQNMKASATESLGYCELKQYT